MQKHDSVDAKASRNARRDDPLSCLSTFLAKTPLAPMQSTGAAGPFGLGWTPAAYPHAKYRKQRSTRLPIRGSLSPPFGASIHPLIPLTFSAGPFRLVRSRLHLEDRYRQPSIVLVCLLRRPKRPTAHSRSLRRVNPLHLFPASCRCFLFCQLSFLFEQQCHAQFGLGRACLALGRHLNGQSPELHRRLKSA
jgi:hypothetical protein